MSIAGGNFLHKNTIKPMRIAGDGYVTRVAPQNTTAVLELDTSYGGFLLPRMTTSSRDAIPNPANSLLVYNSDSEQIEIYSAGTSSWTGLTTGNSLTNLVGQPNGIAPLDSTGKVPLGNLPSSLSGGLDFLGAWNAATNTPILTSGTGQKGDFYKVSVSGSTSLDGVNSWNAGDSVIFDGTTWDKIDGLADEVISVAGRTGAVVLSYSDITGSVPGTALPAPGTTTFGAVKAYTSPTHQFLTGVSTLGIFSSAQPMANDISGLATVATTGNLADLSGTLSVTHGGTGATSALAARAALGVDQMSLPGDTNYTILPTDRVVGLNATLTATRTWTLPAANSVNPGQTLWVLDQTGGLSGHALSITRSGSDLINGTTTQGLSTAYAGALLVSDGLSHWTFESFGESGSASITLIGDATGSGTGTVDVVLATVNSNVGTYAGITVNSKGLVTGATSLTTLAGYGITDAEKVSLTTIGDINYTILASDRTIAVYANFTTPHTWTLPSAAALRPGTKISITDMLGGISQTNYLTISAAGSDTINGLASIVLDFSNDSVDLITDGVSHWGEGLSSPVSPGTYGDSSHLAQIQVDQRGRIVAINAVALGNQADKMYWPTDI